MKRLRKDHPGIKIKSFHSGEYGEATPDNDFIARPHYHAILFNFKFKDQKFFREKEGIPLFTSDYLNHKWGMGKNNSIGAVTFESAAYVARYVVKKITGQKADEHYLTTDPTTGEIYFLQPEYATMSRRPGIGKAWYDEFKSDCYPSDSISIRGAIQRPPKYYDYLCEMESYAPIDVIKEQRKTNAMKHRKDNTPERLAVRETVKLAQTSNLKRQIK